MTWDARIVVRLDSADRQWLADRGRELGLDAASFLRTIIRREVKRNDIAPEAIMRQHIVSYGSPYETAGDAQPAAMITEPQFEVEVNGLDTVEAPQEFDMDSIIAEKLAQEPVQSAAPTLETVQAVQRVSPRRMREFPPGL